LAKTDNLISELQILIRIILINNHKNFGVIDANQFKPVLVPTVEIYFDLELNNSD